MERKVRIERRPGGDLATVVVDNAARLNALDTELMAQFCDAIAQLASEPLLRCMILTGAGGRAFIGGADIDEMAALASPADARRFIGAVHACCQALRRLDVPTIARIDGYCFGAGLEIAASCDLRVASDAALFGMPEVKLGIPSVVEAALLPLLVGWGRTRQMLLLGETFSAATALEWGLVESVAAPEALNGAVDAWVAQLLTSMPLAVRLQKRLIRDWERLPLPDAVAAGIDAFAQAFETDEPARAMGRFQAERARRKAVRS